MPLQRFLAMVRRYLPELLLIVGLFGVLAYSTTHDKDFPYRNDAFLIASVMLSFLGLSMVMYNYLQRSRNRVSSSVYEDSLSNVIEAMEKVANRYKQIDNRIDEKFERIGIILDKNLRKEAIVNFQPAQRDEIYSKVSSAISENINSTFFDSLKEQLQDKIISYQQNKYDLITKRIADTIQRLRQENDVLSKRANINLIIGSLITIAGLILLGYFVIRSASSASDLSSLLIHFIPRFSLVVFIELFSLFFLKLYRSSLAEIKYYQNELTNIELKETSLLTATQYGTPADISGIISTLSNTERNFKLQKGESTVELEIDRIEMDILRGLVKQLNQHPSNKN